MKNEFQLSTAFSLFNGVVVLEQEENHVLFGLLDESNQELRDRLSRSAIREQATCSFEKISHEDFEFIVSRNYGSEGEEKSSSREVLKEKEKKAAVLLLDSLISDGRSQGATDIHIEVDQVRFRVNGSLKTVCTLAPEKSRELIGRIKALSHLEVLEKRGAQDGQFVVSEDSSPLFVRVSCIPVLSTTSLDGAPCQSAVLRLLDPLRCPPEIDLLGFSEKNEQLIKKCAALENGLILVAGPTGSGKTTTAAAMLQYIGRHHQGKKKIITVEDPVEYFLEGITQFRLDQSCGLSFEKSLTYLFRQDPDVLFIGEIRNAETARVALQASLTGHLVIATVHTSGFEETKLRLLQLGAGEKEIHCALRLIICQRLTFVEDRPKLLSEVKVYE